MLDTTIQLVANDPLLTTLGRFRGTDLLVLGVIPSGVRLAARIVAALDGIFDVVAAQVIGSTGAITADGTVVVDDPASLTTGEIAVQVQEAREREQRLRGLRPRRRISNRIVIVVDEVVDGLGAALRAVIRSLQPERPGLVLAVARHATPEAHKAISAEADMCLWIPKPDDGLADPDDSRDHTISDQEIRDLLDQYGPARAALGHRAVRLGAESGSDTPALSAPGKIRAST